MAAANPALAVSVVTILAAAIPGLIGYVTGRGRARREEARAARGELRADYGETQQDLAAAREEARSARADYNGQRQLTLHIENELIELRTDVLAGRVPPLPPRQPWPPPAG